MKGLTFFVVAAALMTTVAFGADQTSELKAIYVKLQGGFARGDVNTLAKYLAKDYTASGPDGKVVMTRDKRVEDLKTQFSHLSNIQWTPTFNSFKKVGKTVVVAISTKMTATLKDPKGAKHTFVFNGQSEDTWAKGKNGWQETHVKVISGAGTMDGHAMGSK